MIQDTDAKKIIDQARNYAQGKCQGIEITVNANNIATSRFANNEMTQNQAPEVLDLSIRVIKDGRQIRLSGDDASETGVKKLIDSALDSIKVLKPDEELLPLETLASADDFEKEAEMASRIDEEAMAMSAQDRANQIKMMIQIASQEGLSAAGVYASGSTLQAIGNSEGDGIVCHKESSLESSITVSTPDSSGWAKMVASQLCQLDAHALADRATTKAKLSRAPHDIDPGRYTVILEPSAVLDLVTFLWSDFAATQHLDKQSCLLDKEGQKVFGQNINIIDDAYDDMQIGAPFDGEGKQRQKVQLVKDGVFKNMVYGRKAAKKMNHKPTGHGVQEPSSMGEHPMNLVMAGGTDSLGKMIESTDKGILLTRVWYVRLVDPARKIVTGITRDGTFLVEGGAIKHGVKNLRFNVSLLDLLNNVESMTLSNLTAGEEGFPAVVPGMKVRDFNFTEMTRF